MTLASFNTSLRAFSKTIRDGRENCRDCGHSRTGRAFSYCGCFLTTAMDERFGEAMKCQSCVKFILPVASG